MKDIIITLNRYWKAKHPLLSIFINLQVALLAIFLFLVLNPYIMNIKSDDIFLYIICILLYSVLISLVATILRYMYFFIINKKHKLKQYIINKYSLEPDIKFKKNNLNYDNMTGKEFEVFCCKLLIKNGYKNVRLTKGSGDQGVDIVATKEFVKYAIQCKCYNRPVGNKAVQEVYSGKYFYNCHVAVVITNQTFTSSAKELAQKNNVLLWDRNILNYLIDNAPN